MRTLVTVSRRARPVSSIVRPQKAQAQMPHKGGTWLRELQARLGRPSASVDLPAALEHPDPVIRLLAAGVVWGRTGGRQPELVMPHIVAAIQSGTRLEVVFGCQLLAELGLAAGDIVPLVWHLLTSPESAVRFAAAFAVLECCTEKRVLIEARQFLEGDEDYVARYVAAKLQEAIEAAPRCGKPFGPVTFSPLWCTDTALALARQMYESRDFGAMPILADALQDAGCESEDILAHCRDTALEHVRGCWVVDLVLGKE
jgi:hypothetical protein